MPDGVTEPTLLLVDARCRTGFDCFGSFIFVSIWSPMRDNRLSHLLPNLGHRFPQAESWDAKRGGEIKIRFVRLRIAAPCGP
jgi:hypothetical protein